MDIPKIHLKRFDIRAFFVQRAGYILLTIVVMAFLILTAILYQSFYQTIVSPKSIPQEELFAKREKINLTLFQQVTENIQKKTSNSGTPSIRDIFQSY